MVKHYYGLQNKVNLALCCRIFCVLCSLKLFGAIPSDLTLTFPVINSKSLLRKSYESDIVFLLPQNKLL